LILILFAPELFRIIFGTEWGVAGEFMSWMAIWFYFQFISSPLSTIITALDHEDVAFYWHGSLLTLRSGALFYGATHTDLLGTIKIFSLVSAACYVIYLAWICRLAGMEIFGKLRETAISGSFALLCLAPALYLKSLTEGGSFVTALFIFFGSVGALAYFWLATKVIRSRLEST
jgi:O-antigen/teichoic acid export membrane protein